MLDNLSSDQPFAALLQLIANHFAAKQYHLLLDNLEIAVSVLSK